MLDHKHVKNNHMKETEDNTSLSADLNDKIDAINEDCTRLKT